MPAAAQHPGAAELRRLYQEEQLVIRQIAARLAVSRATVWRWLREAGIPVRSYPGRGWAARISEERLAQLYLREQLTPAAIALLAGCSRAEVQRRLVEAGIPRRDQSQAQQIVVLRGTPRGGGGPGDTGRLRAWQQTHPEAARVQRRALALRLASRRSQRRWEQCGWCGRRVLRRACDRKRGPFFGCSRSHALCFRHWRCHHPEEPRPLILARLRELAGEERRPEKLRQLAPEVGAGEAEIAELLFPGGSE